MPKDSRKQEDLHVRQGGAELAAGRGWAGVHDFTMTVPLFGGAVRI